MKFYLTALAIIGILLITSAHADLSNPSAPAGRYQIVTSSEGTILWRVDTVSGQLIECIAISGYHTLPDCYPARMQTKSPVEPSG